MHHLHSASFAEVATTTNRDVGDVSPNGRHMLLTIEGSHSGLWELRVADIVWNDGVPSLADIRAIEAGDQAPLWAVRVHAGRSEHIIFARDINMPALVDNQIETIGVEGAGLARLSPADTATGTIADCNEFAYCRPDGKHIIYGRGHDAISGMDCWSMQADGSDSQHLTLTLFDQPWARSRWGAARSADRQAGPTCAASRRPAEPLPRSVRTCARPSCCAVQSIGAKARGCLADPSLPPALYKRRRASKRGWRVVDGGVHAKAPGANE